MAETNQTQSLATLPPPVTPVVVLNDLTLTKLENLEKCLADPVTTQKQADDASHNRRVATALVSELDEGRKKMKEPYLEAGRTIDSTFKPYIERAEKAKETLRVKLSEFEVAKRRKQEEEERIARAEADRIRREAEEAAAAAAEAQRIVDEQRRRDEEAKAVASFNPSPAPAPVDDFDPDAADAEEERERQEAEAARLSREAQAKAQAAMVAPVVVMPSKTAGVSVSVRLEPEVVDIHKVPNEFVTKTLKLADLKKAHCSGWKKGDPIPVVSGITFKVVEGVR